MKQVIVVDESLQLPRGKLAAQVAHASVSALLQADSESATLWLAEGMPKVVLRGDSGIQLRELAGMAEAAGLALALIEDAGHTVIPEGTLTCLGIGPASSEALEPITGALKLVR